MDIRIGFAKEDITPPLGTELGGYAGYRPCNEVHDPLFCKAVVLDQDGVRWALVALDLLRVGPLKIATIPGELFSTLLPEEPMAAVCYANGYYRYIADQTAYDGQYYEAMAAILARGAGEALMERIKELVAQLN